MRKNNRKLLWITRTAAMLAALIVLQALTKPLGQLVTGSCVNAILAITALTAGMSSGAAVALLSPVFAWLLKIAPQPVTVPVIMVGNLCYVAILACVNTGKGCSRGKALALWLGSAAAKTAVLYVLAVQVVCGLAADALLAAGLLEAPMLKALPVTFSWPQLVTALAGGALALVIAPSIKKAMKA